MPVGCYQAALRKGATDFLEITGEKNKYFFLQLIWLNLPQRTSLSGMRGPSFAWLYRNCWNRTSSFTFFLPITHIFLTRSSFSLDFAGEGRENCWRRGTHSKDRQLHSRSGMRLLSKCLAVTCIYNHSGTTAAWIHRNIWMSHGTIQISLITSLRYLLPHRPLSHLKISPVRILHQCLYQR